MNYSEEVFLFTIERQREDLAISMILLLFFE